MPQFSTYANLKTWAAEAERGMLKEATSLSAKDTFVSHSSKDDKRVEGAILILTNHGARVYVDHSDPSNKTDNCVKIADHVRSVISVCRKFVLFATPQSKDSKWMPWELGLADGIRSQSNTAIFPAAESAYEQEWAEQEYLGLYRKIVWGKLEGNEKEVWMVWDPKLNQAQRLDKWIAS